MRSFNKKIAATVAGTALALVASGVAFAYWTTTGSGSGTGATAAANGTVVLHAAFADGLAPGLSTPVTFTADNAGKTDLRVGTITSVVSASGACDPSWFSITPTVSNTTVAGLATGVAVGSGTLTFNNAAADQDACKSATVTLTVSSN